MSNQITKPFVLIKRISNLNDKSIVDTIIGQYDNKKESLQAYKQHQETFENKVWTLYYLCDLNEFINKDLNEVAWFNEIIDQWPGDAND